MDVHRSRFVPYPPSTITSLAFSHAYLPQNRQGDDVRLAVGRSNGDIEIWNPLQGDWVQENIFRGGRGRAVDALVWTQDPDERDTSQGEGLEYTAGRLRLFSVGYSSSITEWDLRTGLPLRDASGGSSAIWCLASQPRLKKAILRGEGLIGEDGSYRGQDLVAGCADGSLVLFSTAEDELTFRRYITRSPAKKAQALSVAFQNRHNVVAGYANGTIRIHDIRNGSLVRNVTLGTGLPGASRDTMVWQVKCLPNGDIVSGDSNGEVRIYDRKMYSERQRVTGHKADILALAVTPDGRSIFSGGTDIQTVVYRKDERGRWAKSYNERLHSHEIKSLATFQGRGMDVVASGGIDASPIVTPSKDTGNRYKLTLPFLPQQQPISSASSERLIATWWDRDVLIWRIEPVHEMQISGEVAGKNWKLLSRLKMKSEENISSASLSSNGTLLAVSTVAEVKIFHLQHQQTNGRHFRIRKLNLPKQVHRGARLVQFSPDDKWFVRVDNSSEMVMARVVLRSIEDREEISILSELTELNRLTSPRRMQSGLDSPQAVYNQTINRLTFSDDSSILVASDISGSLDSWVLESHKDKVAAGGNGAVSNGRSRSRSNSGSTYMSDSGDDRERPTTIHGQRWVRNINSKLLPKLDSAPLVLSFRPVARLPPAVSNGNSTIHHPSYDPHANSSDSLHRESRLLVVTAKHQVYELDILKGRLTDWSKRNPTNTFPAKWRLVLDRVKGCIWDTSKLEGRERLWMYGSKWLFMFDLSRDFLPFKEANGEAIVSTVDKSLAKTQEDVSKTKKRKRREAQEREAEELLAKRQRCGVGDPVSRQDRMNTAYLQEIRTVIGMGNGQDVVSIQDVAAQIDKAEDGSDDVDDENVGLPRIRYGDDSDAKTSGAPVRIESEDDDEGNPRWWCSFNYRDILGVAPVGPRVDVDGNSAGRLPEVAIIERPHWDLDLPPRFTRAHGRN
ncbi:MAG: U3 small nucleolar RNA-associated protein [Bogoriella megaspora]|nr:MAG: U3 small nucleolar RNA-associated protein [Bogoriella megaspora]